MSAKSDVVKVVIWMASVKPSTKPVIIESKENYSKFLSAQMHIAS
jgi:hypothetical protein